MENSKIIEEVDKAQNKDPLVWHYERERRLKIKGSIQWQHTIKSTDGNSEFYIRSNFNLTSNSCYLDVLIPSSIQAGNIAGIFQFVNEHADLYATKSPFEMELPVKQEGFMSFDLFPGQKMSTKDCIFTGRIFAYTSHLISEADTEWLCSSYRDQGHSLIIRDGSWVAGIQKFIDRPVVFLGHDSADKESLVRSLAHAIDEREVRVWYDEISLKPGDRLRKSLDIGLDESDYFIPIITENWMKNDRYAAYEFDAIMQKYITEKNVTIIPVCVGINPSRLSEKSRVLADTLAIVHNPEDPIGSLATKIVKAVNPRIPNVGEPLPPLASQDKPGFFSVGVTIGPAD